MTAYYNEIDPFAAQWLRNLINAGHIAPGIVDERSIEDVYPSDLRGFTQCHFFAGIGVWSHALRAAGWSDDRPVWTGSCPCQPFSAAGQGAGFDDERHLWPHFHHLIKECRPAIVLGEQVASKDADPWIDLVCDDLEALGYSFGAIPFPAAGVGAPHIRDRLYWVADAKQHSGGSQAAPADHRQPQAVRPADWAGGCGGSLGGLADTSGERVRAKGLAAPGATPQGMRGTDGQREQLWPDAGAGDTSSPERVADTKHDGCGGQESHQAKPNGNRANFGILDRGHFAPQGQPATSPTNGYWRNADWLLCRDGRWRPVEPGTFPLVNGAPARVGRLRAYGNAINAKAAQVFIECLMDCTP